MAPQTKILAADIIPPFRDWVGTTGFAGACTVLAALIVLLAVMVTARRADKRHKRELEQRDRAAAIDQCWQRLAWVVTTADTEPAATDPATANMGLGPELALELLTGIGRDAKELGDETLEKAAAVYLNQLGLVLTQQARRLTETATAARSSTDGKPGAHTATATTPVSPNTNPPTASADNATATENAKTEATTTGQGRRRR